MNPGGFYKTVTLEDLKKEMGMVQANINKIEKDIREPAQPSEYGRNLGISDYNKSQKLFAVSKL